MPVFSGKFTLPEGPHQCPTRSYDHGLCLHPCGAFTPAGVQQLTHATVIENTYTRSSYMCCGHGLLLNISEPLGWCTRTGYPCESWWAANCPHMCAMWHWLTSVWGFHRPRCCFTPRADQARTSIVKSTGVSLKYCITFDAFAGSARS